MRPAEEASEQRGWQVKDLRPALERHCSEEVGREQQQGLRWQGQRRQVWLWQVLHPAQERHCSEEVGREQQRGLRWQGLRHHGWLLHG